MGWMNEMSPFDTRYRGSFDNQLTKADLSFKFLKQYTDRRGGKLLIRTIFKDKIGADIFKFIQQSLCTT